MTKKKAPQKQIKTKPLIVEIPQPVKIKKKFCVIGQSAHQFRRWAELVLKDRIVLTQGRFRVETAEEEFLYFAGVDSARGHAGFQGMVRLEGWQKKWAWESMFHILHLNRIFMSDILDSRI